MNTVDSKKQQEHEVHFERVNEDYAHIDVLDEISKEAFPFLERPNIPGLVALPDKETIYVYAVVDEEVPVGFIIWLDLGEGFVYLGYLAIDARYRNRNYGTKTLDLLFNEYLKDKISFGGIEALDPDAENYQQRVTRKRFYIRNGFTVYDRIREMPSGQKFQLVSFGPETSEEELMEKMTGVYELIAKYVAATHKVQQEN